MTDVVALPVPPAFEHDSVYNNVPAEANTPVFTLPDEVFVPLHDDVELLAVHEVGLFVEDQVITELLPAVMEDGLADIVTTGAEGLETIRGMFVATP